MEVHSWYIVSIKLLLINIIHTNDIIIFKPGARRPQAGARLVYRNHFDADVGMCVYVCVYVCVCVCLCVRPPGY